IADALQVNLNGLDLLFLLFFGLLLAALCLAGFLFVLLLVFLFFGPFFLIAFRLERRSLVGLQRHGEDSVGSVVVVPQIELPAARIEVARRNEIQIFPAGVKDRIVIAIKACRNFGAFLRPKGIKKNVVRAAPVGLRISQPQAIRRPAGIRNVAVLALVH